MQGMQLVPATAAAAAGAAAAVRQEENGEEQQQPAKRRRTVRFAASPAGGSSGAAAAAADAEPAAFAAAEPAAAMQAGPAGAAAADAGQQMEQTAAAAAVMPLVSTVAAPAAVALMAAPMPAAAPAAATPLAAPAPPRPASAGGADLFGSLLDWCQVAPAQADGMTEDLVGSFSAGEPYLLCLRFRAVFVAVSPVHHAGIVTPAACSSQTNHHPATHLRMPCCSLGRHDGCAAGAPLRPPAALSGPWGAPRGCRPHASRPAEAGAAAGFGGRGGGGDGGCRQRHWRGCRGVGGGQLDVGVRRACLASNCCFSAQCYL